MIISKVVRTCDARLTTQFGWQMCDVDLQAAFGIHMYSITYLLRVPSSTALELLQSRYDFLHSAFTPPVGSQAMLSMAVLFARPRVRHQAR
jgi:hypothetical protein